MSVLPSVCLTHKSSGNCIKKIRSAHVLIICNLQFLNFSFFLCSFLFVSMKFNTAAYFIFLFLSPTLSLSISMLSVLYLATTYARLLLGLHSAQFALFSFQASCIYHLRLISLCRFCPSVRRQLVAHESVLFIHCFRDHSGQETHSCREKLFGNVQKKHRPAAKSAYIEYSFLKCREIFKKKFYT